MGTTTTVIISELPTAQLLIQEKTTHAEFEISKQLGGNIFPTLKLPRENGDLS